MRAAWIALAMMVACGALADSQPPAPRPIEATTQYQQSAQENANNSGIKNPIHLVCDYLWNNPKGEGKTRCEYEQAPKDWWVIGLGILTLAAIITQCVIYWRQAKIMERGLAANRRPKFLIREAHLAVIHCPGEPVEQTTYQVRCILANAGEAIGTVVESYGTVMQIEHSTWKQLSAEDDINMFGSLSLTAGAYKTIEFFIPTEDFEMIGINLAMHADGQPMTPGLFFRGSLAYIDGNGVRRRTAFCRRLDPGTRNFVNPGASEYEYAD
jgi:hypothetical protein